MQMFYTYGVPFYDTSSPEAELARILRDVEAEQEAEEVSWGTECAFCGAGLEDGGDLAINGTYIAEDGNLAFHVTVDNPDGRSKASDEAQDAHAHDAAMGLISKRITETWGKRADPAPSVQVVWSLFDALSEAV